MNRAKFSCSPACSDDPALARAAATLDSELLRSGNLVASFGDPALVRAAATLLSPFGSFTQTPAATKVSPLHAGVRGHQGKPAMRQELLTSFSSTSWNSPHDFRSSETLLDAWRALCRPRQASPGVATRHAKVRAPPKLAHANSTTSGSLRLFSARDLRETAERRQECRRSRHECGVTKNRLTPTSMTSGVRYITSKRWWRRTCVRDSI